MYYVKQITSNWPSHNAIVHDILQTQRPCMQTGIRTCNCTTLTINLMCMQLQYMELIIIIIYYYIYIILQIICLIYIIHIAIYIIQNLYIFYLFIFYYFIYSFLTHIEPFRNPFFLLEHHLFLCLLEVYMCHLMHTI